MYVCICQAVTEKQIERAARGGIDSLDDLREQLGVAACCGGCSDHAQAILATATPEQAPLTDSLGVGHFQPAPA